MKHPSQLPVSNSARKRLAILIDRIDYISMKMVQAPVGKNMHWMGRERDALKWAVRVIHDCWPELTIDEQYLEDKDDGN